MVESLVKNEESQRNSTMNMMMVSEKNLIQAVNDNHAQGSKVSIPSGLLPNASQIYRDEQERMHFKHAECDPKENLRL